MRKKIRFISIIVFLFSTFAFNSCDLLFSSRTEDNSSSSSSTEEEIVNSVPEIKKEIHWIYERGTSTATSSMQAYWIITVEDSDGDLQTISIDGNLEYITGSFYSKKVYGKTCYGTGPKTTNYYDRIRKVIVYDSKGNCAQCYLTYN